MKKLTRFAVDQQIPAALRAMARESGQDINAMVNDILLQAIGDRVDSKRMTLAEFISWAGQNLPEQEIILKNKYLELLISENPKQAHWMGPKLFNNWIEEYAIDQNLNLKHGKSPEGRWVILSKSEITYGEARKPINKQEFFTWADKNKISQGRIIRKILYRRFLEDHSERKYLSQKEMFGWIYEYGKLRGYSILDGGTGSGQWVMMLLSPPKTEGKQIKLVEKDDFGD